MDELLKDLSTFLKSFEPLDVIWASMAGALVGAAVVLLLD